MSAILVYGMTAARYFRAQVPVSLATLAVTIAACAVLTPVYGLFGAVLATLVACVVQLAGNALIVVYALRQLREPVGLPAPSSLQPVPDGMASAV